MKTPHQLSNDDLAKTMVKSPSVASVAPFNSQRPNSADNSKRNKAASSPLKRATGYYINKIACQYCNDTFLTEAGLRSHVQDHCDKKQYLLSHSRCRECSEFFDNFENYTSHLNETGHAHRNGRIRSGSNSEPLLPIKRVVPTVKVDSITKNGSLLIGSFVSPGSAMAGCAWILSDDAGSLLFQGSLSVYQAVPFLPSALLVDSEALLHGLATALENNILSVTVKTSSESTFLFLSCLNEHLSNRDPIEFHGMEVKTQEVRKLLGKLRHYKLALISKDQNFVVAQMAEKAVLGNSSHSKSGSTDDSVPAQTVTPASQSYDLDSDEQIGNLSLLDVSHWLLSAEPVFKASPRADISPRDYGRTPKNNNAFTSWNLPSNFLG